MFSKDIDDFRKEIDTKEKEAEKKLDEILSKNKMEFCSRCGKKINSRMEWGGKCMEKGCKNLLCNTCFSDTEQRYCNDHRGKHLPEKASTPDQQIFRDEKIKSLTLNYMNSIEERFRKLTVDWVPSEYFKNSFAKVKKSKYGDFMLVIYKKFFIFKSKKIQIMVYPLDYMASMQSDLNSLLQKVDKKVHNIAVFVSDFKSVSKDIASFFEGFSNRRFSLYLVNFENKSMYFNKNDQTTRNYATWFDIDKYPLKFRELLKKFSEKTSGRNVISAKRYSEEFGITKEEAMKYLKKVGFLTHIDETDSFLFKEEKK
ncbi:MAG: hypothetical protein JW754_05085 [Candidatus Aenigmarchaeota archaeon]|nr:hypothetical protein [Candidatus Aenigmarchaeota archaeon]